MARNFTKADVRELLKVLADSMVPLDVMTSRAARTITKKRMLLANKIAGREVYKRRFLSNGEFLLLKLVYRATGPSMGGQKVRYSRLQTTKRRYATQFLRAGFIELIQDRMFNDEPDVLVITDLGMATLFMRR